MHNVAIIGASGFTGAEFLRLCAGHPELEVVAATGETQAGTPIGELYPSLAGAYGDATFVPYQESVLDGVDLVFMALPHGHSQALVPEIRGRVKHVVDLAADFRFDDPAVYPQWYGEAHRAPDLLDEFVFGLPELSRDQLAGAELVAVAGCYVTSAALALAPLVKAGLMEPGGIVVDAASGVSGAGRPPKPDTTFCAVDEDFTAYGLLHHRHTPEIEMAVGSHAGRAVEVLFTPHLAPMNRGILATCYGRPAGALTTEDALQCLADAYGSEPFVVISERSPSTKATLGSNSCHLTARVDPRTGWIVVLSALDNLVKGASGQGIQCANLALGLPETTGLAAAGLYP
ncbi:MAG: N-acetyl-gamma-glutamyl-phosphate reductase [Actinobacteria bacterium]|nr:N-acetyl-gamma-glutamyl-phosphate reductase [Actinomycetota bacterium]NIS30318.1 N-acetyl-gamma-glutamyl-phosphate reductase [Actinomycetota bacterium]NIT94983.1 N-acetyl-gamma-glutamyl-phosphate reductase [Actinomycetota bacterium]NIU18659.1 N-acetyl-gamma-glutamyl-phosphate reductase [Actinomycetota bacterium]NIU65548.1 N-acetyl-gamma-glutamyl-phosphate reductase [Actinomycetota bacterium]